MSEKVVISQKYDVAILSSGVSIKSNVKRKAVDVTPTIAVDKVAQFYPIMYWGTGNDFPQQVIADVAKDTQIAALLNKKAALLYSSGLTYGIPSMKNGIEVLSDLPPAEDKIVNEWLRKTNINAYLAATAKHLYWFANAFTEIILSADGKSIERIYPQPAEQVRLGTQNAETGLIDTAYLNAQWPYGTKFDQYTKVLPVLDSWYDPAGQLREGKLPDPPQGIAKKDWIKSGMNWIYHLSDRNPGNQFYSLATWNALRVSGWLEVSQLIPQAKKALLEKQIGIKYHIELSSEYWSKTFPGFDDKKVEEQNKIIEETYKKLDDKLTGALNEGKSITSTIYHNFNDPANPEISMVKITPIADPTKDGKYLEDGKSAALYKITAIDLHPALCYVPDSGLTGGGSDIREAYNLHMLTIGQMQDLALETLNNVVTPFNGWNPDMVFRFKNQLMTTLDAGKEIKPTN